MTQPLFILLEPQSSYISSFVIEQTINQNKDLPNCLHQIKNKDSNISTQFLSGIIHAGKWKQSVAMKTRIPSPHCLDVDLNLLYHPSAMYFTTKDDICFALIAMRELSKINIHKVPVSLVLCHDLPRDVVSLPYAPYEHISFSGSKESTLDPLREPQKHSDLDQLPLETLIHILSFCESLRAFRSTCKYFKELPQHFPVQLLHVLSRDLEYSVIHLSLGDEMIHFWDKACRINREHLALVESSVEHIRERLTAKIRRKKGVFITVVVFTLLSLGCLASLVFLSVKGPYIYIMIPGMLLPVFLFAMLGICLSWHQEQGILVGARFERYKYKSSYCFGDYTAC